MAQANSVQREPSMEEILASIRRIIEDSESGRKEDGPGARAREGGVHGEVEAFRAEFKPVPASEPEPADDDDDEMRAENEPPSGRFDAPRHEAPSQDAAPAVEAGGDEPPEAEQDGDAEPAEIPVEAPRAWQPRDAAPAPRAQDVAPAVQPKPAGEERGAILSDASGRKVAAAFEELSEAFEASRRKSLADAAEEMLRPMLQEWLDNNLPQLVERLVREEIERVARGG